MKAKVPEDVERCRIQKGPLASNALAGWNGAFEVRRDGLKLFFICSDGLGWEHVSVSVVNKTRCPTWEEMCFIKNIVWEAEEVVMQLHPRKSEYVNCHPYVLHLWRPIGQVIPTPNPLMVGLKI